MEIFASISFIIAPIKSYLKDISYKLHFIRRTMSSLSYFTIPLFSNFINVISITRFSFNAFEETRRKARAFLLPLHLITKRELEDETN